MGCDKVVGTGSCNPGIGAISACQEAKPGEQEHISTAIMEESMLVLKGTQQFAICSPLCLPAEGTWGA